MKIRLNQNAIFVFFYFFLISISGADDDVKFHHTSIKYENINHFIRVYSSRFNDIENIYSNETSDYYLAVFALYDHYDSIIIILALSPKNTEKIYEDYALHKLKLDFYSKKSRITSNSILKDKELAKKIVYDQFLLFSNDCTAVSIYPIARYFMFENPPDYLLISFGNEKREISLSYKNNPDLSLSYALIITTSSLVIAYLLIKFLIYCKS